MTNGSPQIILQASKIFSLTEGNEYLLSPF